MPTERLLCLFIIAALAFYGLAWGFRDTRRVIEMPFLYAVGILMFVLVQMYSACINPSRAPSEAFFVFALMVVFCTIAIYAGYFSDPAKACYPPRKCYRLNTDRLFWVGISICLVGNFGSIQLGSMGEIEEWRGWPVYWATLAKLNLAGISFIIISSVFSGKMHRLWIAAIFSIYPLGAIVWRGRRSMTIMLPYLYLMPFLIRFQNIRLPRFAVMAALAASFVVVYALPYWRGNFKSMGHVAAIQEKPIPEIAADIVSPDNSKTLEVIDGMILAGAVWHENAYELGVFSLYNSIIQDYVPGSLLGHNLKESLKIRPTDQIGLTYRVYGIPVAYYTGKTVFADLFKNFSFMGAIILFFLARFYRRAFHLAMRWQDGRAILFLCSFTVLPAHMVEASLTGAFVGSIPLFALLIIVFRFCMTAEYNRLANPRRSKAILLRFRTIDR